MKKQNLIKMAMAVLAGAGVAHGSDPGYAKVANPQVIATAKVVYTDRQLATEGGYDQMMAGVHTSFALFNEACKNTGISLELVPVFPKQVKPYSDNPFSYPDLDEDILGNKQGVYQEFVDQGADLIVYFDSVDHGSGVAWGPHNPVTFCSGVGNDVLRHEAAHCFGADHDKGFLSRDGLAATVMRSFTGPHRLPYYSSRSINFYGELMANAQGFTNKQEIETYMGSVASRGRLQLNRDYYTEYFLVNKVTGKAVDAYGSTAGSVVGTYGLHYGNNQQWRFNHFGGNACTIELADNKNASRFLTLRENRNYAGVTLETWGAGKQRYVLEEQSNGYFKIFRDDSRSCLWGWNDGGQLIQFGELNYDNMLFRVISNLK
ncbi:RICIN domain-containing protein [Rubritalea tangerina]|uniref:RICIN domain-containing protein n=1 Tax=Rubritalea tangerina TaxID=430798 RepID=A0ABW4ZGI2_9BACT